MFQTNLKDGKIKTAIKSKMWSSFYFIYDVKNYSVQPNCTYTFESLKKQNYYLDSDMDMDIYNDI